MSSDGSKARGGNCDTRLDKNTACGIIKMMKQHSMIIFFNIGSLLMLIIGGNLGIDTSKYCLFWALGNIAIYQFEKKYKG